ncbi:MAG: hypothetical protein ACOCXD_00500 [Bacteroidota bacterium]
MKIHMKIIIAGLIAILIMACKREVELSFNDFDKNGNDQVERREFVDVFVKHYYDDWNTKDNEYLDDEDFYMSTYMLWDENNDDLLSREEWTMGYEHYYGQYIDDEFEELDKDVNGYIDYNEFLNAIAKTDIFADWDIDASRYINEKELAVGVFENWDIDSSNTLDKHEFEQFDEYYLDL